ncbi:hypothetical protein ACSXAY_16945 (plasmid) [Clostridium perfringens]
MNFKKIQAIILISTLSTCIISSSLKVFSLTTSEILSKSEAQKNMVPINVNGNIEKEYSEENVRTDVFNVYFDKNNSSLYINALLEGIDNESVEKFTKVAKLVDSQGQEVEEAVITTQNFKNDPTHRKFQLRLTKEVQDKLSNGTYNIEVSAEINGKQHKALLSSTKEYNVGRDTIYVKCPQNGLLTIEKAEAQKAEANINITGAYFNSKSNNFVLDGTFEGADIVAEKQFAKTATIVDENGTPVEGIEPIRAGNIADNGKYAKFQLIVSRDTLNKLANGTYKIKMSGVVNSITCEGFAKTSEELNVINTTACDGKILKSLGAQNGEITLVKDDLSVKEANIDITNAYFNSKSNNFVLDGTFEGVDTTASKQFTKIATIVDADGTPVEGVDTIKAGNISDPGKFAKFQLIVSTDVMNKLQDGTYKIKMSGTIDSIPFEGFAKTKKTINIHNTNAVPGKDMKVSTLKDGTIQLTKADVKETIGISDVTVVQSNKNGYVIKGTFGAEDTVATAQFIKTAIIVDEQGNPVESIDPIKANNVKDDTFKSFQLLVPTDVLNQLQDGTYKIKMSGTINGYNVETILKSTNGIKGVNKEMADKSFTVHAEQNQDLNLMKSSTEISDIVITEKDLLDGVVTLSNKVYKTISVDPSVNNSKIILDNVEIKDKLILSDGVQYQVKVKGSTVPYVKVVNNEIKKEHSIFSNINKNINGPTLHLENVKEINSIDINGNASIYGDSKISNINILNGELLLDVPTTTMTINKNSLLANITINQKVNEIIDNGNSTSIGINDIVDKVTLNGNKSNIYIKDGITVKKATINGNLTRVMGNGTLNYLEINGNNVGIYTKVSKENIIINESAKNVFIGKEENFKINSITPKQQGIIEFTLNEATSKPLELSDISILCNGGNSMTVFDIKTKDNKTYTLSTSYYKDNIYELYITLPNGNIISKEFNYSYNHPTASKVELNRTSKTNAIINVYGVDEGGYLYYKLVEKNSLRSKNNVVNTEDIKETGFKVSIKSNYNEILISSLKENTEYDLYYVMEGFDGRTSPVYGPLTVGLYDDKTEVNEYKLDYLAEVEANKFMFTFNRAVEGELKLEDFKIICPSESTLTTKGAKFIISPDNKTYTIIVPDNYGHKDNKYTVSVNMPDGTIVEGSFRSHFAPPVINNESIERYAKNKMKFKFNSDEHGVLYYGIYDWNQSVLTGESTTPMAEDVLNGKIKSQKENLNSGYNELDIDLSGYTLTNKSRLWVLYVDYDNNYRAGFVDHYKIPKFTGETTEGEESTLDITNIEVSKGSMGTCLNLTFNQDLISTFGQNNIKLQSLSGTTLPGKIAMSVSFPSNKPNYASIEFMGVFLASGDYRITIETFDSMNKPTKIIKEFNVK